jgi:hypothetical protein
LGIAGRLKRVVIEETNRKQKQELIAVVEIPIIADFHLLDLYIKKSLFYFWEQLLHIED